MQFPVNISLGNTKIALHVITEALGIFIGFRYFLFLRRKQKDVIETSNRIWILIGAIAGSFLGSRFVGGLENITLLMNANNKLLFFFENKTVLGGFLFGVFGVELVKIFIGEKKASGDLFVYPMILALIIGRVGCFSMGVYEETYGVDTSSFLGMNLGDGIVRHPVALYEIGFLILFWFALYQLKKNVQLQNGALFKLMMIGYLIFRFLLDFIKPHYTFNIGLSTIQLTCVLGLLYYYRYLLHPKLLIKDSTVEGGL